MRRVVRMLGVLLVAGAVTAPAASAGLRLGADLSPVARAGVQLGERNPWLDRRVLNIAHRGGELEHPDSTLYALDQALRIGSDMLEIDVAITRDGHLVVVHDTTVDRTTDGSGRVADLTLAQLKALDAAYWFVPGCGACHGRPAADYPFRGIATGHAPPPDGYSAADFRIATLGEVLERFPGVLTNIEIKGPAPDTDPAAFADDAASGRPTVFDAANALALQLRAAGRSTDVVVVSFSDAATTAFKAAAPAVHTAPGVGGAGAFFASSQGLLPGAPNPAHVALQLPTAFSGLEVVTGDLVADAHRNGLAVHVFLDYGEERAEVYDRLIAAGVDGIMTARPGRLEDHLRARGLARPAGS